MTNISSNTMTLNDNSLRFNLLSKLDCINHAFSTRLGGVSGGEWESMNLSFGRGDPDENVLQNYRLFCKYANFNFDSLTASAQVHETNVRFVTEKDRGVGIYRPKDMPSVDALITNDKAVTLVTYYADCTPVFIVDPVARAVGLVHAGWRSTVGKIVEKTINAMHDSFGTEPKNLVCAIGPVIGRCCYEVDADCARQFDKLSDTIDISAVLDKKPNGKYMADLALTNKLILRHTGVREESIAVSDLCTRCNSELLWSHRATNGHRGTMAAFLQLI